MKPELDEVPLGGLQGEAEQEVPVFFAVLGLLQELGLQSLHHQLRGLGVLEIFEVQFGLGVLVNQQGLKMVERHVRAGPDL